MVDNKFLPKRYLHTEPDLQALHSQGFYHPFASSRERLVRQGGLRDGGIAVLMVSDSGVARLKDVVGKTTND